MKRHVAAKMPPQADGMTLLDYLATRFNYHSREDWQARICNGELSLSGKVCTDPATVLVKDTLLEYTPENLLEPAVNTNFSIIYEDDYLLVIDKPGNLPVHPAGPYFNHTLWALLVDQNYGKVHMVNRLDRETSGLLIAAKTAKIAGALAETLPDMLKKYQVAVHGNFPQQVHAQGFLVKDTASVIRKKQRYIDGKDFSSEDKSTATAVETLFTLQQSSGDFSLVNALLRTGRMHQIRATLHSLNYPVIGDKLYGLDENFYRRLALDTLDDADWQKLILPRQALHCAEMSFVHPVSGRELNFSSPLPAEIAALFQLP